MATFTRTSNWTTFSFSEKPSYHQDKVRVVGIEDYKACARTLAEAFFDDDVAFFFLDVPDNGGQTRQDLWPLHLEILEYIVCAHIYNGLVLSIGENHEGVALWYVALSFWGLNFSVLGHLTRCFCALSRSPTSLRSSPHASIRAVLMLVAPRPRVL